MWVRMKLPNMQTVVVETDKISMYSIDQNPDDKNEYTFVGQGNGDLFVFHDGTFSECHMLLNKIIQELKLNITEITL